MIFRRTYHSSSHGAMFAYIGRSRSDVSVDWVDETSNPLPLTVALLYRAHCLAALGQQSSCVPRGSSGLSPAALLQKLCALWGGDPRDLPRSTNFTRSFPYLFHLEYGLQGGPSLEKLKALRPHTKSPRALLAINLTSEALALVSEPVKKSSEAAVKERLRKKSIRDQGVWSSEALSLLSSTSLYWLPRLTSCPCADTWGPIIREILEREGVGGAKRMLMEPLLLSIGREAIKRSLPLPPNNVAWFALSPHPSFSRLRVLWEEQTRGGVLGKSNRGPVAIELLPEGMTFLHECIDTLRDMASKIRKTEKK